MTDPSLKVYPVVAWSLRLSCLPANSAVDWDALSASHVSCNESLSVDCTKLLPAIRKRLIVFPVNSSRPSDPVPLDRVACLPASAVFNVLVNVYADSAVPSRIDISPVETQSQAIVITSLAWDKDTGVVAANRLTVLLFSMSVPVAVALDSIACRAFSSTSACAI